MRALHFKGFVILLSTAFLVSCGRFEEVEEVKKPESRAKFDALLAAARFTEAMGVPSRSYGGIPRIPPAPNTTLILPVSALQNVGLNNTLEEWIEREGGHLIVYLTLKNGQSGEQSAGAPFLDYWEVTAETDWDDDILNDEFELTRGDGTVKQYKTDFITPTSLDWAAKEGEEGEEGAVVLSTSYGEGKLSIWSTFAPFTNEEIGKAQHAELLWDYLEQTPSEEVIYVYGEGISFFQRLWQDAALAVVTALLLVCFAVWSMVKRFGPQFKTVDYDSAYLYDHFRASGRFFLRHGAAQSLLDELKEKVYAQLAVRCHLPATTTRLDLLESAQQAEWITAEEADLLTQNYPKKSQDRQVYLTQFKQLLSRHAIT